MKLHAGPGAMKLMMNWMRSNTGLSIRPLKVFICCGTLPALLLLALLPLTPGWSPIQAQTALPATDDVGVGVVQIATRLETSAVTRSFLPLIAAQTKAQPQEPADATVLLGYPTMNLGDAMDLWTGYDHCATAGKKARSLLWFDLSGSGGGPAITKATLHVWLTNSCDIGERTHQVTAYRLTSGWSEMAVNWNNQPGFAEPYGSVSIPSQTWGWYGLEITDLVRGWLDGAFPNHGLMLRGNESAGNDSARLGFRSRENPQADLDPYIQIVRAGSAESQIIPSRSGVTEMPAQCGPEMQDVLRSTGGATSWASPGFAHRSGCEER